MQNSWAFCQRELRLGIIFNDVMPVLNNKFKNKKKTNKISRYDTNRNNL